jgi:crotonobetainyl-CoA:carnitine CoA-transferase CaiB-like acyl-CoA transferase
LDSTDGVSSSAHTEPRSARYAGLRPRAGPLAGVRIADFCWMGVGAIATRFLADMGAEVIKIEHASRLDLMRRIPIYKGESVRAFGEERIGANPNASGMFNNYSRNKLSVSIDMRKPSGRAMAERLIAISNVVTENFAPGVMERWKIDYARICELSPQAIYARMSGFGHSGPYETYRSYGPIVQAMCGLSHISGLPGKQPSGWGLSYMDNQAAYYNTNALLTAIYSRQLTGEGCEIDVAAVDVGVTLVGPLMLDVAVNGKNTRSPDFLCGNKSMYGDAAPHGVYPTKGEDKWIALAVENDAQWRALAAAFGSESWCRDLRFASGAARKQNQDSLDALVAEKTRTEDAHELMHRLQAQGVPAAAAQDAEDLLDHDPQLALRNVYFTADHPVIGPARFEGIPVRFSRSGPLNWRSSPLLGEDNAYVFRELLGLSEAEYSQAANAGAF